MAREYVPSTADHASLSPRGVLHGVGALAVGGTAKAEAGAVMAALSTYMANARARALPDAVIEKVKHHVLDTLAAMISGAELKPGRAAISFARAYGGSKIATVAGSDVRCGPIEAALANGVLAHADETDDSHNASRSHPGCAVVPAAFAVAQHAGVDGARLLRAVALGYDIGPRVVLAMGGAAF
ncbi:MAG: MmgE/PrpD family protein, partial [Xanthobacteraceae bacterium]